MNADADILRGAPRGRSGLSGSFCRLLTVVCWTWVAFAIQSGCARDHVDVNVAGERHGLVVSGSGVVLAAPDTALVRVGVEVRDPNVKAAVDANNKQMSLVVANLKGLGVAAADMQSADFNIRFEEQSHPPHPHVIQRGAQEMPAAEEVSTPASSGTFVVSNTLQVRVRELDKLGDVLSTSVSVGANSIWGVSFEIGDPKPLQAQARDQAVADAMSKARRLAEVAGARLGPLLRLEEDGDSRPSREGMLRASVAKLGVPMEAGTMEVTASVTLEFALEPPQ